MEEMEKEIVIEEPKPKAPKPVMVEIKPIAAKGKSVLVEWIDARGMYRRGFVPVGKVKDQAVDLADLVKAIPYGLPWEQFIQITATPESIANSLRKQGVWTFEDLSKMNVVMRANQAFLVAEFMRKAKKEAGA